jgi:hypothetical protein
MTKRNFLQLTFAITAGAAVLASSERFDYLVRGDFFAGMAGDDAAMTRAMKLCEDTLAQDPQHAEALVWHGSGQLVLAGKAFEKGEMQRGGEMWTRGLKEMDAAGRIAPDKLAVLIPRGATYLQAAQSMPPGPQSKALTQQGVADYQKVWDIQKAYFDTLSGHQRGELLFGLAGGYDRLGEKEKARSVFEALAAVGKSSGHDEEAREYLEKGSFTPKSTFCAGCHAAK